MSFYVGVQSQSTRFSFESRPVTQTFEELNNEFRHYQLFSIETKDIKKILPKSQSQSVDLGLTILEKQWHLSIQSANIAPVGTPQTTDATTTTIAYDPTYKGVTHEGLPFRLTINDGFIAGILPIQDHIFYIEPLQNILSRAKEGIFILYEKENIKRIPERKCMVQTVEQQLERLDIGERVAQGCVSLDLAVATDVSMFKKYISTQTIVNHVSNIMNLVEGVYGSKSFNNEVQFRIVKWVHATTTNAWINSLSPQGLLENFSNWGSKGGFQNNYDLGQLWTNQDLTGSTIGIAWLRGVCAGYGQHHVVQDFSASEALMLCLVAHEIGHNFSMTHNSQIMAPSVSTSNQWSSTSANEFNAYVPKLIPNCLALCGSGGGGSSGLAPAAVFSFPQDSICINKTFQLENNTINAPTSYKWTFNGGTPATSTEAEPKVYFKNAGTYVITLTATNIHGSNSATKKITITTFPTPAFTYKVQNQTVVFTNVTVENAKWAWKFGDGKASTDKNPTNTYANNGTYNVILSANNSCGARTITKSIPVFSTTPTAAFQANILKGCSPLQVQFNNLSTTAQNYSWIFQGAKNNLSTDKNPIVIYEKEGVFDVLLVAYNGSFSDTLLVKKMIRVTSVPKVQFETEQISEGLILFKNMTSGADSLRWDFGNNSTSMDSLASQQYLKSGTYIVKLTAYNACGTSTKLDTLRIVLRPTATFSSDSVAAACDSLVVMPKNLSSDDSKSYIWLTPNANQDSSTVENPHIVYKKTGKYTIFLIAKNEAGVDTFSKSIEVTINQNPTVLFKDSISNRTVWLTNQSTLAEKYYWDFGDGQTSALLSPQHQYKKDGIYKVALWASNVCDSLVFIKEIRILTMPVADFEFTAQGDCEPLAVNFKLKTSENTKKILWQFQGGIPDMSLDSFPKITYNIPGTYSVMFLATNDLGTDTLIKNAIIKVQPKTKAAFDFVTKNATVEFKNKSTFANNVTWHFGDGNKSSVENPVHQFQKSGNYEVRLISTNDCNIDSIAQLVNINIVKADNTFGNQRINIFPNPSDGLFNLTITGIDDEVRVSCFNAIGLSIFKDYIFPKEEKRMLIDLSVAPKGVYFLTIETEREQKIMKIISH
jgi:PKD repeat protein